jgi:UDP-2,3-diacylglucosamine hydrolase
MSPMAMPRDQQTDAIAATAAADSTHPLAMICGGGSFPPAVAEVAARRGRLPVIFALRGWVDPKWVEQYRHHWITVGQLGRFLRLADAEHCREVVIIGTLLRPPLAQIRLDWRTLRLLPRIARSFRGGDNRLLSAVASMIEDGGVRVIGIEEVAPEIIVAEGVLGAHQPSPRDRADIARALTLINALDPFDVGQAAVVADNHVLAVEAAEGTDAMLARIAELRRQGRVTIPAGVGVLVKAPKHSQDRRIDLPAIGLQTVERVAQAGLAGLAVAAGGTIIAEAAAVTAAADRAGIFLVGVREDTSR